MNELKVFENPEFGRVRTVSVDNEPWFFAKDVCDALSIATNHVRESLDEDEVSNLRSTEIGPEFGGKAPLIVSEAGLYSLILKSRKPEAKAFKRWITHEVIPAIRKHGGYMTPEKVEEALLNPDVLIRLATELKEERNRNKALHDLAVEQDKHIARQNDRIATLEPKGIFADSVSASDTTILIGELAKIIKQNGTDIGQNRLFQWMRDQKYLIGRKGTDYNMPTQKAMKLGLFTIKETTINHSDGHVSISKTPKVTGKGQVYFVNKFLRKALN
ncbi:phage antirepressor KilAC domain-containing protein [uncultured Mitsuokella sp.]|uniref:phage antirepressor KilAC domain-containing protein n=1 Tax=uncultured Mitsuokella sp. TaxID=453120 RepID=UPI002597A410|nr:phage antirepressor KilAC domain-containing protein [uncultured Mitsuokella sp.]